MQNKIHDAKNVIKTSVYKDSCKNESKVMSINSRDELEKIYGQVTKIGFESPIKESHQLF